MTKGYKGGVHEQLAVAGRDRLAYYVAQYDGEIAAVDQEVGRVLDALRETGQLARTVVMVTSDHGESLGEHEYYFDHGEDLFEPSLRIPLVIAAPGAKPGQRNDAMASTLDLLPTQAVGLLPARLELLLDRQRGLEGHRGHGPDEQTTDGLVNGPSGEALAQRLAVPDAVLLADVLRREPPMPLPIPHRHALPTDAAEHQPLQQRGTFARRAPASPST